MKKLINKIKGLKVKSNLRKDSGADEFIIKVILCVIGAVLAVIYRDQISNVMTTIFAALSTTLKDLISGIK